MFGFISFAHGVGQFVFICAVFVEQLEDVESFECDLLVAVFEALHIEIGSFDDLFVVVLVADLVVCDAVKAVAVIVLGFTIDDFADGVKIIEH